MDGRNPRATPYRRFPPPAHRKEARQHEATDGLDGTASKSTKYRDPGRDPFDRWIRPVLDDIGPTTSSARTGLSTSAISDLIAGRTRPQPTTRRRLSALAHEHARHELLKAGIDPPKDKLAQIYAYLRDRSTPLCGSCGAPITHRGTFCSTACRQAAYRSRSQQ